MTDLLMRVLQNSVIASFLFLIIQWLRPVLKQYRYSMFRTLWIVLILFLLIPVDISIPNITHELKVETEYVEPLISGTVLNEVEIIINHEDSNENESLEIVVPQQSTQDKTSYSISNVFKQLSLVDLTGFSFISISLILAAFQLFTFFWFHRLLLMSGQRIGGKEVPWIMSDLVDSPLLTGLVHPVIALPADIVDHPHLDMMIEHEMMHYQKKDLLMKFLMLLAKCIHWFNPIVYLMEKQLSKDLEMACDEEVLKNADEEKKQIYAQTLLDMVCKTRFSKEAFTTQFSSDDFKMRIRNVFDTGRNKVGKLIVVFVFGIITGISVLFSVELFSDSISQFTVYQVKENEKAEYAVVSGESAALLTEYFSGIDYIGGTFAAKKQWEVTIDKNLYEFSFFNDGIVVWRNTEEYKILQNTSDIELIRTILKIQDHSTDSQKEDNPQSNNQNKYSSEEEQYFVEKGYLNALNGLNQFNEKTSASFSQYTLQ
ncbi:MAG: M56 family metallopeptidase, partial [Erysipelotrichaceae bacterium]|nr:M56 family metallopeptidase [Erysipelotrichaceae bacterium]